MVYYAQIMAGGTGKRMGNTKLPKQFLTLGKKPIIIHTLEKFILNDKFEKIVVSTPNEWAGYTNDIIKKFHIEDERVCVISGGKERNDTLKLAIEYIEKENGISEEDVLVVHDAVRPFITKKIIDENLKAAEKYKCVDTTIPAFDTIVKGKNGEVVDIPIRDFMYQGQTPQTFHIKTLMTALDTLTDKERDILSDSCKIMLLNGQKVGMVEGDVSNIKITTPFDLKVASTIIEESR